MTRGADIIAAIILLALAIAIIVYYCIGYTEDHQKKFHLYVQECLVKKLLYQEVLLSYL